MNPSNGFLCYAVEEEPQGQIDKDLTSTILEEAELKDHKLQSSTRCDEH